MVQHQFLSSHCLRAGGWHIPPALLPPVWGQARMRLGSSVSVPASKRDSESEFFAPPRPVVRNSAATPGFNDHNWLKMAGRGRIANDFTNESPQTREELAKRLSSGISAFAQGRPDRAKASDFSHIVQQGNRANRVNYLKNFLVISKCCSLHAITLHCARIPLEAVLTIG